MTEIAPPHLSPGEITLFNARIKSHGLWLTSGSDYFEETDLPGVYQSSGSVFINSGPLFHIGTLWNTLVTFHVGGTNVFVRRVDASEICRLIETERCTDAYLLPPTREQSLLRVSV